MSASRKMLDENISKLEISLLGRAVHHAERGESHLYRSEERLPSILPSRTTYLRTRVWGAWGCIRLPETRFRSFGNWISSTAGRLLIRLRLTIHIRGYDFYDFSSARLIKYFPWLFSLNRNWLRVSRSAAGGKCGARLPRQALRTGPHHLPEASTAPLYSPATCISSEDETAIFPSRTFGDTASVSDDYSPPFS